MARPPKTVTVSLQNIFPLLLYYYAAVNDKRHQGEYSTDWTWESLCRVIDDQLGGGIKLSPVQLSHLLYNYKIATYDKRIPTGAVKLVSREYLKNMKALMKECPNLFKKDADNDVVMVDVDYE